MLGFLVKLLFTAAGNGFAVYIASRYVGGFSFSGNLLTLATAGFLLAIGNTIVRPILKIIAFPLILLTFGLFNTVINMSILWGVARIIPDLSIDGIVPLFYGTVVVSIFNLLFSFL